MIILIIVLKKVERMFEILEFVKRNWKSLKIIEIPIDKFSIQNKVKLTCGNVQVVQVYSK